MGTKNKPGKFDCFAAALPDEPMFTLLGRDVLAAPLVRLWAALRERDLRAAENAVNDAYNIAEANRPRWKDDGEKITEAVRCSEHMADWCKTYRDQQAMTSQFDRANAEGFCAGVKGQHLDNPYVNPSIEQRAWQAGWCLAVMCSQNNLKAREVAIQLLPHLGGSHE